MQKFKVVLGAILVVAGVVMLTGCDGDTRTPEHARIKMQVETGADHNRVSVRKLTEFSDGLAYNDKRGIYLITDKQTGKEYIGVSGVGITETGSHGCGKSCTRQDER